MQIKVPHRIEFHVDQPVPIADVVASLLATEQLLRDTAPLLQECFPGLQIENIEVSVGNISEGSLKELLYAAMFVTFQKDLESEVPAAIQKLTGTPIQHGYETIVTVVFCLLLFYGVDLVYTQTFKGAFSQRIREQLKDVSEELARECGIPVERISHILETRYGKSRLRLIAHSALKFFTVSKKANNAPLHISKRNIDHETVAEIPSEAQLEEASVPEIVQQFENVLVEIHAQDVDRTRTGWAAVVPKISSKRLKMELYPPIRPDEVYTRKEVRGDVSLVLQKKSDGSYQPSVVHLMRLRK